jgi:hypothetical protein
MSTFRENICVSCSTFKAFRKLQLLPVKGKTRFMKLYVEDLTTLLAVQIVALNGRII